MTCEHGPHPRLVLFQTRGQALEHAVGGERQDWGEVRVSIRRQCGTGTLHWDSLVRKSLMAEVLVSLPPMMGVVSVTVLLLASRSLCTAPWPCEDPLFLTNITCHRSACRVPVYLTDACLWMASAWPLPPSPASTASSTR